MNEKFEIRGVNHIAMVCADMSRTVRFYRDVLGMQLVKTLDIPGGGQESQVLAECPDGATLLQPMVR